MLPALRLRLRASCLKWQRLELHGHLQPRRCISNGSRWNDDKKPPEAIQQDDQQAKVEDQREKNMSLLDQLFPEMAHKSAEYSRRREREVPRLPLDLDDVDVPVRANGKQTPGPPLHLLNDRDMPAWTNGKQNPELPLDGASYWDNMTNTRKRYTFLEKQGESISVLVLQNASKNLVEEDFRRVIPQGKHIEGWNLERGDILKGKYVVPGRDTSTLERLNFYFILFKSPVSAFAYQTHVTRLHKLARANTPNSLMSFIPPPPGYLVDGEDIDALIQSYSLVLPAQDIHIRQLLAPFTPSVQQIVDHMGYPHIVSRPKQKPVEVLLRLESGRKLSSNTILQALEKEARARDLPWTGDWRSMRIFQWEAGSKNVSPLGSNKILYSEKGSVPDKNMRDPKALHESPDDQSDDAQRHQDRERQRKAWTNPSYIVGFNNEAEAQTFVSFWHRRPITPSDIDLLEGDIEPIVNAEVLW